MYIVRGTIFCCIGEYMQEPVFLKRECLKNYKNNSIS